MILGHWHDNGSAARVVASFSIEGIDGYSVETEDGNVLSGEIESLEISERLGDVERKIRLKDGSVFTTIENDAIDEMFPKKSKINRFIHYLETHMLWIVVAFIVTVFAGFSFFKWGIPWASVKIAHSLPQRTNELISTSTMEFLDKYMFNESNLSKERQEEITNHFKSKLAPLSLGENSEIHYVIHFRSWEMGEQKIPNALALPSGDIILTDKFVELSSNLDEIDSVLLHEMGHVVHRHGLEMVIEGTFMTVAVMLISGDEAGVLGDMGVGVGSALLSSKYARKHESEADLYAFKHMLKAEIDPKSFSNIMNKMVAYMEEHKVDEGDNNSSLKRDEMEILDYFASHPSTQERVNLANRYSECFKAGVKVCE